MFLVSAIDYLFFRNIVTLTDIKYRGLIEKKDSIELIVLGNSHAHNAVNPSCFADLEVYNIAEASHDIILGAAILEQAQRQGLPNLKYVLISVDYHTLFQHPNKYSLIRAYYSSGVKLNSYNDLYYKLADISPLIFGYSEKTIARSFVFKQLEYYLRGSNNQQIADKEHNTNNDIYNGFSTYNKTNIESFNKKAYNNRVEVFTNNDLNYKEIERLEEVINNLIKQNIKPILFSAPTYCEYNKLLDKQQIKKTYNEINRLCSKYNIKHFSFENDERFVIEDFYNCDHLNYIGAEKFSRILADTLGL